MSMCMELLVPLLLLEKESELPVLALHLSTESERSKGILTIASILYKVYQAKVSGKDICIGNESCTFY